MTIKFKLISFTLLLFTIGTTLPPSNFSDSNEYNAVFVTSPSVGYDFNIISYKIPFTVKDFVGFKEFLGFFESGSDYKKINRLGYLGKYQFGRSTLKVLRVKKINEFIDKTREEIKEMYIGKDEENMSEDEEWELSENAAYTAEQNKKESEREKKDVTRESREDPLYNERVKNAHNSKQKHS